MTIAALLFCLQASADLAEDLRAAIVPACAGPTRSVPGGLSSKDRS